MKERKELFYGSPDGCEQFIGAQTLAGETREMEIIAGANGPLSSVFYKRKTVDKTIRTKISRETRERFRVNGVTKDHHRPLVVTLEPGDVISFRPKGTQQSVSVPIASLYQFAKFTAARAIAAQRRAARNAGKGTR